MKLCPPEKDTPAMRVYRIIILCAGTIWFIVGSYDFYLEGYYPDYPQVPDPAHHRVAPLHWKSATIFMTVDEKHRNDIIQGIMYGDALIVAASILLFMAAGKKLSS